MREMRGMLGALWAQARTLAPLLVALYGPATAALLVAVARSRSKGVSLGTYTRDPATFLDVSPLVGALSNVGVLGWCAAATLCLFTWLVRRRRTVGQVSAAFFLSSGLLMTVLMVDDLFLGHDWIGPNVLGVPENLVLSVYVLAMLTWLVAFRRTIVATEYLLLVLAAGFAALSLAVDLTWDSSRDLRYFLEDGSKLLGIVGWLGYFARVCYRELVGFRS